jgi:hypothetical protein
MLLTTFLLPVAGIFYSFIAAICGNFAPFVSMCGAFSDLEKYIISLIFAR